MTAVTKPPSGSSEAEALAKLLLETNFYYRSPVVRDPISLLAESECLLEWRRASLDSVLMVGGDDWPVVDVQIVAAVDAPALERLIQRDLPLVEARVQVKGGRWLRILGGPAWLTRRLSPRYNLIDTVVFYARERSPNILQPDSFKGLQARRILSTDLDQIKLVDEASFTPFWQASMPGLERWLLNANHACALTAGSRVVAFIYAGIQDNAGHIWRLAVLPEWQGRGLGRWMITSAISNLLADGATSIALNTQASNQRARHLYERLGFTLTGQEVSVWARDIVSQEDAEKGLLTESTRS